MSIKKRYTDVNIWSEDWLLELPPEYILLFFYIKDKADFCGLWRPNKRLVELLTGKPIDLEKALELINNGKERIRVVGRYWYLVEFVKFQYGDKLNIRSPFHKNIINSLTKEGITLEGVEVTGVDTNPVTQATPTPTPTGTPPPTPSGGSKEKEKEKESINIIKDINNKSKYTKDTYKERGDAFKNKVADQLPALANQLKDIEGVKDPVLEAGKLLDSFISYWLQTNEGSYKYNFEKAKDKGAFSIPHRLSTFVKNYKKEVNNGRKTNAQASGSYRASYRAGAKDHKNETL